MQTYKLEVTKRSSFRHKCRKIETVYMAPTPLHLCHYSLSAFFILFPVLSCFCFFVLCIVSFTLHLCISYCILLTVFLVVRCTALVYLSHFCATSLATVHYYFQHYRRPVNEYMTSYVFIIVPPLFLLLCYTTYFRPGVLLNSTSVL